MPQPMALEVPGAPSAYLRWLLTQDTERMAPEIKANPPSLETRAGLAGPLG